MNTQVNKIALVTGSARRIGAAIAQHLHQAGFDVIIHYHQSLREAHTLIERLNRKRSASAFGLNQNLLIPNAAHSLIDAALQIAGRLDLLINNASLFLRSDARVFNESDWDNLFALNTKIPFLLSLAAYPHLAEQQGGIINITDIHAHKPLKGYAVYCQSKAALAMQTQSLAKEFAPQVRVNSIAPGAIIWPEGANELTSDKQERILEQTPLKCHGKPEFIAQTVLAVAANPFITGQVINIDGGRSLN